MLIALVIGAENKNAVHYKWHHHRHYAITHTHIHWTVSHLRFGGGSALRALHIIHFHRITSFEMYENYDLKKTSVDFWIAQNESLLNLRFLLNSSVLLHDRCSVHDPFDSPVSVPNLTETSVYFSDTKSLNLKIRMKVSTRNQIYFGFEWFQTNQFRWAHIELELPLLRINIVGYIQISLCHGISTRVL